MISRSYTHRSARAAGGFTIIELMFVIVIIAVLGGIVAFNFVGAADTAKVSATEASIKTVKAALSLYRGQYSAYPPTLQALLDTKSLTEAPKDGWNNPFEYYSPTINYPNGFELISAGSDGQFNTADDIRAAPDDQ